jgi:hypothetical protein
MRKIAVIGVAVVATLAFAGSAQAASTSISSYGQIEFGDTGYHVAFGQVFSPKSSCSANRKVKLVSREGSKQKLLDSDVSSADGAISGAYTEAQLGDGTPRLIAPETKKCEAASATVQSLPARAAGRRAATLVSFLGVNGKKQNGAFAGLILLEKGASKACFGNRKISLYGDGELLDQGRTSRHGSWALHVTKGEFNSVTEFTAKVRKSKKPACGSGSTTYEPLPLSARWRG